MTGLNRFSIVLAGAALLACGGTAVQRSPVGASPPNSLAAAPPPNATSGARAPVPSNAVAQAAQPFDAEHLGRKLSQAQLFAELSRYDVICLGEAHDQARDHYAELAVTTALAERARYSGRTLAIGFEMFQEPFAPALQAYGEGRLNDVELRKRAQYDERWGFPYVYYQPILAFGRARGLPLLALNAARELSHAIAEKGLAGLLPREQRELPELDLTNAEHRSGFDRAMAQHPKVEGMEPDNFYAAQVLWDETMAENATTWVTAREPSRQLVLLAGRAHCRKAAIPGRVERRAPLRVVSVQLGSADGEDDAGFDYRLIFES